jgi:outer membrane biosynthesis protein TonB
MARLSALLLAFLLGVSSAAALASCGGGEEADLLPGTTADQIESNLTEVERLADAGDCIGAEEAVAEVIAEVEELQGVDLKLKTALEEGTTRLSVVVGRCEEETTSEETEPTLEAEVEPEEVEEDEKKPKKEKPDKEADELSEAKEEPAEEDEGEELPPQANGEEKGGGEPPAAPETEEAAPPGGVAPSRGVE